MHVFYRLADRKNYIKTKISPDNKLKVTSIQQKKINKEIITKAIKLTLTMNTKNIENKKQNPHVTIGQLSKLSPVANTVYNQKTNNFFKLYSHKLNVKKYNSIFDPLHLSLSLPFLPFTLLSIRKIIK